jgi:hypothetical protein
MDRDQDQICDTDHTGALSFAPFLTTATGDMKDLPCLECVGCGCITNIGGWRYMDTHYVRTSWMHGRLAPSGYWIVRCTCPPTET